MALIRYAEGQQRSGSIGGSTYSHNRFGQYVRARSIPVNPLTDRQNAVRVLMAQLVTAWGDTLTQGQRNLWTAYATAVPVPNRFGDSVTLTGLNMYVRSNLAGMQAGLARLDDAPVTYNMGQPESALVVTASEATQLLSIAYNDAADWCDEDGSAQIVSMGSPQSASRAFFGGPWRYAGVILGNSTTPLTSPQTVTAPFTFSEGHRVWVRTRIYRADGRLSVFAQTNFLAAA